MRTINLFNLVATLKLNSDDFTKKLNESSEAIKKATEKQKEAFEKVDRVINGKVAKSFERSGKTAKKLGETIDKYVVRGLAGVTAGLTAFATMGIKSNGVMEQSQVAWTTLLGSQEEAIKMLNEINDFATKTPFSKMNVDIMAKQLKNAGFEGKQLFEQLTKFGDMGSAFAIQEESLKEMVRQYAQVQQAGTAYTEDLNILQDRGIPIYKALSETLGVTIGDVRKMASEGEITAEIYDNALNSIADSTKGAMESQSKTALGLFSTIKDNTMEIIRVLSQPLFEKFKEGLIEVSKFVDKAMESANIFAKGMEEGKSVSEAFSDAIKQVFGEDVYNKIKNIGDIVFWTTTVFAGFRLALLGMQIASGVVGVINSLKVAMLLYKAGLSITTAIQMGFNFSVGLIPMIIGAVILAVVLLTTCIVKNWSKIKAKTTELWNGFKDFLGNLKDSFVNKTKEIIDNVVSFFNDLPKRIGEAFESAKQHIINKLQEWGNAISNFFTQTIPAVFQQLWDWFNQIPYILGYALSYSLASIIKFGIDSWNYLSDAIPKLIESIGAWFSQLPEKIYLWLIDTKNKFVQWVTELGQKAQELFSNLIQGIVNWFAQLPSRIMEWLITTKDNFVQWISDLGVRAREGMNNVVNTIVDAVTGLPGQMIEIGKWIVEGLWRGISNAGNWLKDRVKGFFSGIVDGAKAVFDIHSPSKVFEQIGVFNIMGLEKGTKKQMKNSERVIDEEMKKVIPEAQGNYEETGRFQSNRGNNYNVNVNYTGKVEDEFELRRKLSNDLKGLIFC